MASWILICTAHNRSTLPWNHYLLDYWDARPRRIGFCFFSTSHSSTRCFSIFHKTRVPPSIKQFKQAPSVASPAPHFPRFLQPPRRTKRESFLWKRAAESVEAPWDATFVTCVTACLNPPASSRPSPFACGVGQKRMRRFSAGHSYKWAQNMY